MRVIPIVIEALGTILQRFSKGTGRLRNQRINGGHPDRRIIKIGHNTEESPDDLRRISVTQTQEKEIS